MKVYEKLLLNDNDTAFYLFDIAELKRRIFFLRSHLPKGTSLCFAVKANPFLARELTDCVDRFEICAPGEARICYSLNVPKNRMVISGVYKTPTQVRGLLSDPYFNGVITVESVRQYRLIGEFAQRFKRRATVLLRLTNKSQFGLNKTEIEQIISQRGRNPRISVAGLQFFSGTQKTSIKKIRRELEELDLFLLRLKEVFGYEAEELEYGPGFPVPYFDGEPFDEEEYLREFSSLLSGMHSSISSVSSQNNACRFCASARRHSSIARCLAILPRKAKKYVLGSFGGMRFHASRYASSSTSSASSRLPRMR